MAMFCTGLVVMVAGVQLVGLTLMGSCLALALR